jgi:phosphate transport system protein
VIGVLRHLFSEEHPLEDASGEFARMLKLASGMVYRSSQVYWGTYLSPVETDAFHASDSDVDRLQREVRKRLLRHFSAGSSRSVTTADAAKGLTLMSLVKDVERLGDYANNLLDVHRVSGRGPGDIPADALGERLRGVAQFVETTANELEFVFAKQQKERAVVLMQVARVKKRQCDEIVFDVAREVNDVGTAVDLTLAARYYKRMVGHASNLLSSLLVPVHRLDQVPDSLKDESSLVPNSTLSPHAESR